MEGKMTHPNRTPPNPTIEAYEDRIDVDGVPFDLDSWSVHFSIRIFQQVTRQRAELERSCSNELSTPGWHLPPYGIPAGNSSGVVN